MPLTLDNRTQTFVQVAVSTTLYLLMLIAWRTQKTYPGFRSWMVSNLPNGLGWLLISLRGLIPEWASVVVGNILVVASPLLLFEGIRQFRGKPARDWPNIGLLGLMAVGLVYFTWAEPSVKIRVMIVTFCTLLIILRCTIDLYISAASRMRPSYWLTGSTFGLSALILILRLLTAHALPDFSDLFQVDVWQSVLFLANIVLSVAWTFGFFMMTNARLTVEVQRAEAELREMAMTDYLTGAYNRRSFDDLGRREFARARRSETTLALLIIDIDHFKIFNDTYGHLAGDEMLCNLVAALRLQLREVDLLARWGGEEFAVLLPGTERTGSLKVAEKLRQAVCELTVPGGGEQAQVTISVGGAVWSPDDPDLAALLRRADLALYQAKRRGRNCVVIP